MNKDIIKQIIKTKMDILDSITEHLPDKAKEKVSTMQHDFMTIIGEAANEYLEKKKPDNESKQIKKVSVE